MSDIQNTNAELLRISGSSAAEQLKSIEVNKQRIALLRQLAALNIGSSGEKTIDVSTLDDAENLLNATERLLKKAKG